MFEFETIDTNQLYNKLKTFDFITFDIFDTLLKRDVPEPTNVFDLAAFWYQQETGTCLKEFVRIRREAERKARECSAKQEVTLKEIYRQMPLKKQVLDRLCELEVLAESVVCVVSHPVADVYQRLLEEGKTLYLISDMYLPRLTLIRILEKCGIYGYKKLFLSNEYGLRKRDGLFDKFLQEEGLKGQTGIHIGDDWRSDVLPLVGKSGYRFCKIPHRFKKERRLSDSTALSLARQTSDCFINHHMDPAWPYFKRTGYAVFGTLLSSFILWVKRQVQEQGINKVLFLARDGYVLEKAWKILASDLKECTEDMFYLSRVSILPTRLNGDYSIENILKTIPRRQVTTVEMVLKRVDLYTEENIRLAQSCHIAMDRQVKEDISAESDLYQYFQKVMRDLPALFAKEADRFAQYTRQFIQTGDRVAVVDIGWNGTAQKAIELALEGNGKTKVRAKLYGCYLGLNQVSLGRDADIAGKGFLVDEDSSFSDRSYLKACMGILEFYLTAPFGMTIGYQEQNGLLEPVFGKYEYSNPDGTRRREETSIADLQEGSLEYVRQLKQSKLVDFADLNPLEAMMGLRQLCVSPSWKDIQKWGDTDCFENKLIPFARPQAFTHYLLHPADLKKDFGDCQWKIGFLRRLLHNFPAPYFFLFQMLLKIFHK